MKTKTPPIKRKLIIFIKAPQPGEVKTRLLPHLNSNESAALYSCFVKDILQNIGHLKNIRFAIGYQPHPKAPDITWTGLVPPPETFRQEGKSLGERLSHAFGVSFGRGDQHVVIIGSDAPTLTNAVIEQAFKALEESDLVLGPALDGGYYLIGLSRPCLKLFEDISWSTDQVFEHTSTLAQALGYTLRVLPPHYDVDTIDDLNRLHHELVHDPALAPRTEKFLLNLLKAKAIFTPS